MKKAEVGRGTRDPGGDPGTDRGGLRAGGEEGQRVRVTRWSAPARWRTDGRWLPDRRGVGDARGSRRLLRSDLYREATASITTEPKVVMTWPVHGLDDGSGWRAAG